MTTQGKPLTFGELEPGQQFIGFPLDGDDSGHGGYRRGSFLFTKLPSAEGGNAKAVTRGTLSHMPDGMAVIKVL